MRSLSLSHAVANTPPVTAIDPAAFRALLSDLDSRRLAGLAAAVWEARGRTVAVEGDRVQVDGRFAAVRAAGDATPVGPEVDLLVSAADPPPDTSVEVVGPDTLREQLLYAVDGDRRAAIASEFLGEPLLRGREFGASGSEPREPPGTRGTAPGTTRDSEQPRERGAATASGSQADPEPAPGGEGEPPWAPVLRRLTGRGVVAVAAVAALALTLGGAAVLAPGLVPAGAADGPAAGPQGESAGDDQLGVAGPPGADGNPAGSGDGPATAVTPSGPGVSAGGQPPGVDADGSIDERALAAAHTAALENRSYRVTLVTRVYVEGRPVGLRREVVSVARNASYTADVTRIGEFPITPATLVEGDVYVNGSARVERIGPASSRVEPAGADQPVAGRVAQRLRWYLSVERSRVREVVWREGDGTEYWLTLRGDSWPGVADTTGSALVTREGIVREVRRSYRSPDQRSVSAVVTLRVSGVGTTTVSRPSWYGNRTTGGR